MYEDTTEQPLQPPRKPRLRRARAPTSEQLTELASKIAHRVRRHLGRVGETASDDGMDVLRMSSITYRIAKGG